MENPQKYIKEGDFLKRTKSLERYFYAVDYEKKIKSKLTKKQFSVYTYLLSQSMWDAQTKEQHYYVYKNSFTITEAAAKLKISRPTWRAAIDKLKKENFISEQEKWYEIYFPKDFAPLHRSLISFLLDFSVELNGGNLVGVYATLYKYWYYCQSNDKPCCISINQLLHLFEARHDNVSGRYYEIALAIFESQGLMIIQHNNKKFNGGQYTEYEIKSVNTQLPKNLADTNYGPDDVKEIVEALETSVE